MNAAAAAAAAAGATPAANREQTEAQLRAAGAWVEKLKKARADSAERAALDREADEAVRRARALVDAFQSADAWVKSKLAAEAYRVEGELKRARLLATSARSDPLLRSGDGAGAGSGAARPPNGSDREAEARHAVLRSGQLLAQGSASIADTSRLMIEARDQGVETLGAVQRQGEDLQAVAGTVSDTNATTKQARAAIRRMALNALYNRVFLWLVVVALFVADVAFLYYGFLKHDK